MENLEKLARARWKTQRDMYDWGVKFDNPRLNEKYYRTLNMTSPYNRYPIGKEEVSDRIAKQTFKKNRNFTFVEKLDKNNQIRFDDFEKHRKDPIPKTLYSENKTPPFKQLEEKNNFFDKHRKKIALGTAITVNALYLNKKYKELKEKKKKMIEDQSKRQEKTAALDYKTLLANDLKDINKNTNNYAKNIDTLRGTLNILKQTATPATQPVKKQSRLLSSILPKFKK